MKYTCALTADCVIFSGKSVLLIKRKNDPFKGFYALPGGFVEDGETVDEACKREAKEETNLDIQNLELIGAYAAPNRDPRGRIVSFAFLATADLNMFKAGDDAAEIELVANWENADLAFDHKQILYDALEMLK